MQSRRGRATRSHTVPSPSPYILKATGAGQLLHNRSPHRVLTETSSLVPLRPHRHQTYALPLHSTDCFDVGKAARFCVDASRLPGGTATAPSTG
ncbi:Hypothetical protein SMAX5B_017951 [Scophthalmus maximus]|uniref:Uncharacterized protein n=1 Tax=Scophthalmus maximus TaxID=52904 RepID=A0A2U9CD66_SCOMX|nr:Hypothetical protein SMAX5B_017951 [Scophthalmus maximus]KAF0027380.1 hypothetical protein F2P81_020121 [Scophthalmus maximus]